MLIFIAYVAAVVLLCVLVRLFEPQIGSSQADSSETPFSNVSETQDSRKPRELSLGELAVQTPDRFLDFSSKHPGREEADREDTADERLSMPQS